MTAQGFLSRDFRKGMRSRRPGQSMAAAKLLDGITFDYGVIQALLPEPGGSPPTSTITASLTCPVPDVSRTMKLPAEKLPADAAWPMSETSVRPLYTRAGILADRVEP